MKRTIEDIQAELDQVFAAIESLQHRREALQQEIMQHNLPKNVRPITHFDDGQGFTQPETTKTGIISLDEYRARKSPR